MGISSLLGSSGGNGGLQIEATFPIKEGEKLEVGKVVFQDYDGSLVNESPNPPEIYKHQRLFIESELTNLPVGVTGLNLPVDMKGEKCFLLGENATYSYYLFMGFIVDSTYNTQSTPYLYVVRINKTTKVLELTQRTNLSDKYIGFTLQKITQNRFIGVGIQRFDNVTHKLTVRSIDVLVNGSGDFYLDSPTSPQVVEGNVPSANLRDNAQAHCILGESADGNFTTILCSYAHSDVVTIVSFDVNKTGVGVFPSSIVKKTFVPMNSSSTYAMNFTQIDTSKVFVEWGGSAYGSKNIGSALVTKTPQGTVIDELVCDDTNGQMSVILHHPRVVQGNDILVYRQNAMETGASGKKQLVTEKLTATKVSINTETKVRKDVVVDVDFPFGQGEDLGAYAFTSSNKIAQSSSAFSLYSSDVYGVYGNNKANTQKNQMDTVFVSKMISHTKQSVLCVVQDTSQSQVVANLQAIFKVAHFIFNWETMKVEKFEFLLSQPTTTFAVPFIKECKNGNVEIVTTLNPTSTTPILEGLRAFGLVWDSTENNYTVTSQRIKHTSNHWGQVSVYSKGDTRDISFYKLTGEQTIHLTSNPAKINRIVLDVAPRKAVGVYKGNGNCVIKGEATVKKGICVGDTLEYGTTSGKLYGGKNWTTFNFIDQSQDTVQKSYSRKQCGIMVAPTKAIVDFTDYVEAPANAVMTLEEPEHPIMTLPAPDVDENQHPVTTLPELEDTDGQQDIEPQLVSEVGRIGKTVPKKRTRKKNVPQVLE